jgi:hypothetical protein
MHLEPKMMLSAAPYQEKDGDQGQVKETICLNFSSIPGDPTDPKKNRLGKTDRKQCIVFLWEGQKNETREKPKRQLRRLPHMYP